MVFCFGCNNLSNTKDISGETFTKDSSEDDLLVIVTENPEYISGVKVMDLMLADMDQVFETLKLSGKQQITEKIYIEKVGIEREVLHYTANQKIQFAGLDFLIAFYFNQDADSGKDVLTFVDYYRDYTDIDSLFQDATNLYQGLVALYGDSSDITGNQRFSVLKNSEELQTNLDRWDLIDHWDLPDLNIEEMISFSSENGIDSMNPEVLNHYHCRMYIEKESHGNGYRLYITYRAAIYT